MTPSAEGSRSMSAYLSGDTFEFVQKERDDVLNCRKEDLNRLSELVRAVISENNLCGVGGEEQIEADRELFDEVENLFQTGGEA